MIGSISEVRDRLARRTQRRGKSAAIDASVKGRRGCIPVYSPGLPMRCPSCGHGAFSIGRATAECGRCGMALPLVTGG